MREVQVRFQPSCKIRPFTLQLGRSCACRPCPRIASFACAISTSYADLSTDYYHVGCFEELLDLSSPHYLARLEPDRRKYIPDRGAQCILEEYISRWKLRIQQTRKHEGDPQSSSSADHVVTESSSTRIHSPTADATEQQVPTPKAPTEPGVPEYVPVASNESPIETPSISVTAVQPSSASNESIKPDVWTIADALWDCARQAEAEASRRHDRLFGESSSTSNLSSSFCNFSSSLRDRRRTHVLYFRWVGKIREIFVN
jgi:hypothetical protein